MKVSKKGNAWHGFILSFLAVLLISLNELAMKAYRIINAPLRLAYRGLLDMKNSKDKSRSSLADKFVNRSDILRVLSMLLNIFPNISSHMQSFSKTIFKTSLVLLLLIGIALATHNPSVSHPANVVTNGMFLKDYSSLEVRL